MTSDEIRESFLSFFESKGCVRQPSSSLIPDDPSLLLTAAGMVQFKPVFLGTKKLPFTRAVTAQKCVRTTDIDIIGTTGRHLSFFEMLGNFSFGDYFKAEAIAWAWEYSTEILGLDPDRIWVTIYLDDDQAYDLWLKETPVPPERIVRLGDEDNFWAAGPTGPCGPCSELYYDQGPEFACGPDCGIGHCDCDRYLEYWNLVFTQFDRAEDGTLVDLPRPSIDTGMGLERISAIMQGVQSNYESDLLRKLIELASAITGKSYHGGAVVPDHQDQTDIGLRILADHARSVAFMIADGILPSNEGRGYVLRRLLRRAALHGHLLGVNDPFMGRMVEEVITLMGEVYPELVEKRDVICSLVVAEEERFRTTLQTGLAYLDRALAELPAGTVLSGAEAFKLHDTFGFPIDLTIEIARSQGYEVDVEGFDAAMAQQKQRARAAVKDVSWTTYGGVFADILVEQESKPTEFTGYTENESGTVVIALIKEGARVERLAPGETGVMILNRTPFYGERGGQAGDTGTIVSADKASFVVADTKMEEKTLVAHYGTVAEGTAGFAVGESVDARIDVTRRERIRRNHTATHLLHWALRKVLGTHVTQAGSSVAPDRLRFDFTHFEKVTSEQLDKIEQLINAKIAENHPVRAYETSLEAARESGVIALFGEKYGEFVRVLEIGNFSKELCGGTHIGRTTEIGLFKIVAEESVGANVRRIEAVTSYGAYEYTAHAQEQLREVAAALKAAPAEAATKAAALLASNKDLEHRLREQRTSAGSGAVEELAAGAAQREGYRLVVAEVTVAEAAELRNLADALRSAGIGAAILMAEIDGKAAYLAAATEAAVAAGFDANAQVKALAAELGGRGGGRPTLAQGGADDADTARALIARLKTELA
ncbi:MAG: alanine--tRNA ligase [Coriobacteriia bacterium]|nr:alanine--tRNA ligase [Coriobacteriia bacterium]